MEIESLMESTENQNEDNKLKWLGFGSSPLMAFYKIDDYFNSMACLMLPNLSGIFTLSQMVNSNIEGTIENQRLIMLSIKSASGEMMFSIDGLAVQEGNTVKKSGLPDKFKFGPWLVEKTTQSYMMSHIVEDMQIKIVGVANGDSNGEKYLDLEMSGTADWSDGLLEEFSKIDVSLIEKQTKIVPSTTLLVNEKYVPAISTSIDSFSSKCWKVDSDHANFLY